MACDQNPESRERSLYFQIKLGGNGRRGAVWSAGDGVRASSAIVVFNKELALCPTKPFHKLHNSPPVIQREDLRIKLSSPPFEMLCGVRQRPLRRQQSRHGGVPQTRRDTVEEGIVQRRAPHRRSWRSRRNQAPALRQGRRLDPPRRQEVTH